MRIFETAFKKQYSIFQNAIDYIFIDESLSECSVTYKSGDVGYSFRRSDCYKLQTSLVSHLGLRKLDNFNYPYARKSEVLSGGGKLINSSCDMDSGFLQSNVYTTKDGAIVLLYNRAMTYITIDVNGEKGPNKWGYDVFFFTLTTKKNTGNHVLLSDELCSMVEKGGRFPRTILQNKTENDSILGLFWK